MRNGAEAGEKKKKKEITTAFAIKSTRRSIGCVAVVAD
jgi:hypothetical protein